LAKSKKRKIRKNLSRPGLPAPTWMEDDGMHVLIPDEGAPPDLEAMSRNYRDQVRRSPLWETMVAEFGAEKAERMLKEFKVELKP
jgi:hypothetical protein